MDILFFISILFLVFAHAWGVRRGFGSSFFLVPFSIFLAFSFFKVVPYGILSYYAPAVISPAVLSNVGIDSIQQTIIEFNFLYAVFIFFVTASFSALGGFFYQRKFISLSERWVLNFVPSSMMMFRLLVLAVLLFVFKWIAVGGAEATILGEELDRGSVTSGLGYVIIPADLSLALCSFLAMLRYRRTKSLKDLIFFLGLFVFCAFSFSLFGGRKLLLQHVVLSLVFWTLAGGRIQIFSVRSFFIAGLCAFYFLFILDARLTSVEREVLFDFGDVFLPVGVVTFFSNFSYNDGYYFILDYFSKNDPFWGRTYLDLLVSPIPSGVYPNKPPVDDGVYVKALLVQHAISFPAAASDFSGLGSIPPETFGNAILNFGRFAVPFFGCLLGVVFALALKTISVRYFGFVSIFIVYQSALNFQISNLRIVGLLTYIVFLSVLWAFVRLKIK